MAVLSGKEVENRLKDFPGWTFDKNQIEKTFQFKDFNSALKFINELGAEAESMNHHPDIFLFSWNKVRITISTHSEGGITQKDFTLASKINGLG
jgi:4a-hydroxytetrahydrobiopterin dehydratase